MAVVLARALGPKDYGVYVYVYALISLLAIPAQFGLLSLVVRETARTHVNEQWGLMRGLWRWAGLGVCVLALLLALLGNARIRFPLSFKINCLRNPFWWLIHVPCGNSE